MKKSSKEPIIVGRFGAPFGVQGWIKVISFTDPKENILDYQPWLIETSTGWETLYLKSGKPHSNNLIVKLPDCDDRDVAQTYTHAEIAIYPTQLPAAQANEYYWSELEGLTVTNVQEHLLGKVTEIVATGANDVLVVTNASKKN